VQGKLKVKIIHYT